MGSIVGEITPVAEMIFSKKIYKKLKKSHVIYQKLVLLVSSRYPDKKIRSIHSTSTLDDAVNKPVDYKLKVHRIINTASMLEFQLRNHKKSGIEITWRDLIMEAKVFHRSAELSIVKGSNLDPKKSWYVLTRS